MPRVMLLVTDLNRGGAPLRIARMARRLPSAGFEPVVGCLAGPGPLAAELERDGIVTFTCGARHRLDVSAIGRLAAAIRRHHPDIVHATLFHANIAARLVAKADRSMPVITASATIEVERPLHRLGEMLTSGWSDWHTVNSAGVADQVCHEFGWSRDRVVVVPNPVDLDEIDAVAPIDRAPAGIPVDRPMLLWAGRMDPVKRVDFLLDVLDRVRLRRAFTLVLCGDGPLRLRIEQRIAGLAWSRDIRLLGWRTDVVAWMKAADLVLLPSRSEGSPNVVLEAMAAGCCVLASDIAPCRELIEPGVSGALAPSGDLLMWAAAVEGLLADREGRERLARAGRGRVAARHRWVDTLGPITELYRRALDAFPLNKKT